MLTQSDILKLSLQELNDLLLVAQQPCGCACKGTAHALLAVMIIQAAAARLEIIEDKILSAEVIA